MKFNMRVVGASALLSTFASLLLAALPFTDTFTNTDGTSLTAHNAAWAMNSGTAGIYANTLISTTPGTYFLARITGETFSDDQYSQCVLKNPVNNYELGPAVRVQPSAITNYHLLLDMDTVVIRKTVAAVSTVLATTPRTNVTGDLFRITAVGTTISAYVNGSSTPLLSATDSDIATGVPGLRGFNYYAPGSGQNRCDDYEAGNASAGGGAPARKLAPVPMMF